mgnify:FL=1
MSLLHPRPVEIYADSVRRGVNALRGQREITAFFKRKAPEEGGADVVARLLSGGAAGSDEDEDEEHNGELSGL